MQIDIDGLRVERERRVVLDIPTLSLQADRCTAILGPNGAGKTTLLRLIAGLERPAAGRVRVGGRILDSTRRSRRDLAFVFQEQVFLRQSVRQNLELGLKLRGIGTAERNDRIAEAAELLGIGELLGRRADELSGGEGRRASFARALCLRAPLVLLDEPLAGLDPPTYSRLRDELPRVLRAFRATTLLVTNDPEEALRLGNDLVVLIEGRVRARGDRQAVFLDPKSPEVAEMLGYLILEATDRRVAVRPGSLAYGPGQMEFRMVVEEVVDLVDRRDVVGTIGTRRVHIAWPSGALVPRQGEPVTVHATRACGVS